ncbi:organic cation transporter protein-like isoform X2 [Panulirus ornatus]|uniref:organic cation transporter protein-like isoform X2 n=1 Tax=Panulirus ornatus TaxID=150431 RepID=UPI003A89CBCE
MWVSNKFSSSQLTFQHFRMAEEENNWLEQGESDTRKVSNVPEEDLKQTERMVEGTESSSEAFQTILRQVGESGPWQWRMLFITGFCGIFCAFPNFAAVFLAASPDHWCSVPGLNTTHDLRNISIPWLDDGAGRGKYSSCSYYDRDWSTLVASGALDGHSLPDLSTNISTKECHQWIYDHSVYKTTIVEEVRSLYILQWIHLPIINSGTPL